MECAIGIVISTLSILVTVLIGWQIYNYIMLTKTIDSKIDKRFSEFTKQYKADQVEAEEVNNKQHYKTLLRLLFIIEQQALRLKDSRVISYCYLLDIKITVEARDEKNAIGVYDTLKFLIEESNNFSLLDRDEIEKLKTNLQELSTFSPVGFDCLILLNDTLNAHPLNTENT